MSLEFILLDESGNVLFDDSNDALVDESYIPPQFRPKFCVLVGPENRSILVSPSKTSTTQRVDQINRRVFTSPK